MQFGIPSARLPILSGVSTRLLLNSSAMHSVWPPVAVCYVLVGLPSWKPEKRAYGFVVRNFAVSVIALSASGRTLMWQARFYQALPKIVVDYPSSRWLFLTLTVRNCEIGELGTVLTAMNAAFKRMEKRKELSPVQGWIRATEVTRGKDGSAHPHFHCLLMVQPSWFKGKNYVKHERWVELWRDCLRVNYEPNIDIRAVKTKTGEVVANVAEQLQSAVAETLKYSVKPEDMANDPEWFLELTRQLH